MRSKKLQIYQSRKHLFLTLLFVVIPFLFLLVFSRVAHIATSKLFFDTFTSLSRIFVAYLIAAFLGWTFAILFYKGKRSIIALPIFDVLQSFPTFAALPLAVSFWGETNTTVIIFLIVTIIWPVFFSVLGSLRLIKHEWEEAVQILDLGGRGYLKNFLWPVSVPGLITGSIVGLGDGWGALVATEIIVGVQGGLGNFFRIFSNNTAVTSFGILGFLIIIFSINKLIWSPLLEWNHKIMEE